MQRSRQIGQELAIILKKSQILLQVCDIGRTLGLYDCIHLLREGTNAIFVHTVSKKLESELEENAVNYISWEPTPLGQPSSPPVSEAPAQLFFKSIWNGSSFQE